MDEREFFDEKSDKKPANLSCPHCHQSAEYEIQWLVRMKKKSLPPRADDRDRAKFAKALVNTLGVYLDAQMGLKLPLKPAAAKRP